MHYEIIVRQVDGGKVVNEKLIKEIEIKKPTNVIDLGFRHCEQVDIISNIQDSYIPLQCQLLFDTAKSGKLVTLNLKAKLRSVQMSYPYP